MRATESASVPAAIQRPQSLTRAAAINNRPRTNTKKKRKELDRTQSCKGGRSKSHARHGSALEGPGFPMKCLAQPSHTALLRRCRRIV